MIHDQLYKLINSSFMGRVNLLIGVKIILKACCLKILEVDTLDLGKE